jgi:mRNA interferase RelE/StbE
MVTFRLLYSETCHSQIKKLHPTLKPIIRARLDLLKNKPFSGKPLERELSGYRSFRARRFRIIYKVNEPDRIIEIHYVGHRKDVYELFAENAGHSILTVMGQ